LILGLLAVVGLAMPARASVFDVSYDASVAGAPAAFRPHSRTQ
jgi:hypothetical protein